MHSFADNIRGIAMMAATTLVFIVNDTLIKLVSANMPIGELMVIRGAMASLFVLAYVFLSGAYRQWRTVLHPLVFWRTIGEIGGTILYLLALFNMPIGNVTAIDQVGPLMITAGAAIFLREPTSWRQWVAIAIGFAGVLVIVRPGVAGFDFYALFALGSMLFITMRDLVTRRFATHVPTILVMAVTAVSILATGGVMSASESWITPEPRQILFLAIASLLLLAGYGTSIAAMRVGAMAVVAPFRYLAIVFAVMSGYLVWGDIPDAYMLVGTAIIIATGIYTFYSEQRTARSAKASAGPAGDDGAHIRADAVGNPLGRAAKMDEAGNAFAGERAA